MKDAKDERIQNMKDKFLEYFDWAFNMNNRDFKCNDSCEANQCCTRVTMTEKGSNE